MANRLQNESSLYLKQHAENPVNWFPWGPEALEKAKTENKPILLSVGYSACHWCHVMAHECFENPEIAKLMNDSFVNIKVDREERPDLDQIYQNVAQILTRSGGWPLTVFLTPDLKPFYGGTYFPPEDKWGRPGFPTVLLGLAKMYAENPKAILENAEQLTAGIHKLESFEHLKNRNGNDLDPSNTKPQAEHFHKIAEQYLKAVDWHEGGIGSAPKFPNPMYLNFLWRYGTATKNERATEAVLLTLSKMAAGGIYDHLGGGFARYSTDDRWLIPHFEKMLYDNGLLLKTYAEVLLNESLLPQGNLSSEKRRHYLRVLSETCEYVLREMTSDHGLFFSSQDADSEGEEGKFFVWSPEEIVKVLGEDAANSFCELFNVTSEGNFEHSGKSALHLTKEDTDLSPEVIQQKKALFKARSTRIAPGRDEKSLTSWNALMIQGLLWAARALRTKGEDPQHFSIAQKAHNTALRAFRTLIESVQTPDYELRSVYHAQANPPARFNGYLDDYAFIAEAALDVARLSENITDQKIALQLCRNWCGRILREFHDANEGGFFFTATNHETLISRPKSLYDQAIPSGIAIALKCFFILGEMDPLKNKEFLETAEQDLYKLFPLALAQPFGFGELICTAFLATTGPVILAPSRFNNHQHFFCDPTKPADQICHQKTCTSTSQNRIDLARYVHLSNS